MRGELDRPVTASDLGELRMKYAGHTHSWNPQLDQTGPAVVDSGPVSLEFGPPVGFGL